MKKIVKIINDNQEEIFELNPLDNAYVSKNGFVISWQIDPNIEFGDTLLEDLEESKINVRSVLDVNSFKDSDVELIFEIDGKAKSFYSPMGEDGFTGSASFRIKY